MFHMDPSLFLLHDFLDKILLTATTRDLSDFVTIEQSAVGNMGRKCKHECTHIDH